MTSDSWLPILLSVQVALIATLASLPFGLLVAWVLARKQFAGKAFVETLINLPLVLPPVVTGYLLLVTFGRNGFVGQFLDDWFGLRLVFDWKGAALAAAVVSFPLMTRSMRVALTSIDPHLEHAARSLGAGRVRTFLTITLPLAQHGIIAGCLLAFARSLGEFGATIMIAGNIPGETRTIPLYIYDQLQLPGGVDNAIGVVIFSVIIAAAALLIGEWLHRRSAHRFS